MARALDTLKRKALKAGKVPASDALALAAVVEAFASHGHPLTCKGCRAVLEAAKAFLRQEPDLKAVGKAGGCVL